MLGTLINLLIWLIILGVLWYAIEYAITHLPVPDPPARLIRIVVVLIFCLLIIGVLLSMVGGGGVINLPRFVN